MEKEKEKTGYITFKPQYGKTLYKKWVKKSTIPPKISPNEYVCDQCNELPDNGILLVCDFNIDAHLNKCDRSYCFTCASVDSEPEGEWYCNKH